MRLDSQRGESSTTLHQNRAVKRPKEISLKTYRQKMRRRQHHTDCTFQLYSTFKRSGVESDVEKYYRVEHSL